LSEPKASDIQSPRGSPRDEVARRPGRTGGPEPDRRLMRAPHGPPIPHRGGTMTTTCSVS